MADRAPAPKRPPVSVVVETVPGEPFDLDAWVADVVALAIDVDRPKAGARPVRCVG